MSKKKFEKPVLLPLGALVQGAAANCEPGSSATPNCEPGGLAGGCETGNAAGGKCESGILGRNGELASDS